MAFVNFLGWIGAAVSVLFFSSPSIQFYKLFKKKIHYVEINILIIIANYFSCIVWLIYGYSIKCIQINVSNGIGAVVSLAWTWIYSVHLGKDHLNLAIFFTMGLSAISFVIYILLTMVINKAVGQVCLVLCSLSYLSSSKALFEAYRTKNYKLIQIYSAILSVIGCAGWFFYGLLKLNMIIIVPNLVGFVIAIAQVMFWRYYKVKQSLLGGRVRDVSISQSNVPDQPNPSFGLDYNTSNINNNNTTNNDFPSNLEPNNSPLPGLNGIQEQKVENVTDTNQEKVVESTANMDNNNNDLNNV